VPVSGRPAAGFSFIHFSNPIMASDAFTLFFRELTNENVALVGGKNASLGE
jgi:hypothetical protein